MVIHGPSGALRRYEGGWEEGLRHGEGKCAYANGDAYSGAWAAGVRSGAGTCAYAAGGKYTGPSSGACAAAVLQACMRQNLAAGLQPDLWPMHVARGAQWWLRL